MNTIRVFALAVMILSTVAAQVHLRGNLETSLTMSDLSIDLRSAARSIDTATTVPTTTGQFDFPNVTPGQYVIAIKNSNGEILKEEYITVASGSSEVHLRLIDRRPPVAAGGTVDARRLRHQVPKTARKAMMKYKKSREKGDEAASLAALNEALTADPELLEAYVNRSAYFSRLQQWEQANADIDRALKIDPNCSLALSNRAFVAVHTKQYAVALVSAKAAVRTDPANLSAQYFVGLAQLNLGDYANGFKQLDRIADEYEPARMTLQQAAPQRKRIEARAKAQSQSLGASFAAK